MIHLGEITKSQLNRIKTTARNSKTVIILLIIGLISTIFLNLFLKDQTPINSILKLLSISLFTSSLVSFLFVWTNHELNQEREKRLLEEVSSDFKQQAIKIAQGFENISQNQVDKFKDINLKLAEGFRNFGDKQEAKFKVHTQNQLEEFEIRNKKLITAFSRHTDKQSHDFKCYIENIMLDNSPTNINALKRSGIRFIDKGISLPKLIENAENTNIDIHKMYIKDILTWYVKIHDAIIKRKCTFRILISDPFSAKEAINRRTLSVDATGKLDIMESTKRTIDGLYGVKTMLYEKGLKQGDKNLYTKHLEIRLHDRFIATSLCQIGQNHYMSLYLNDMLADDGFTIGLCNKKEDSLSGHLSLHFEKDWEESTPLEHTKYGIQLISKKPSLQ